MAGTKLSIVIDRPRTEVAGYMNDVQREPEWQPQLLEAEQTPEGPTQVGSRRRYVSEFLGRRIENTYVVEDFEPDRRIVLQTTKDSVLDASVEIGWDDAEDGTRVTMRIDGKPSGALRFLPKSLLEGAFEKELRGSLSRLKKELEAGA